MKFSFCPKSARKYRASGSALFNTCRKALGHLMKFTQPSIPYRFGLAGSTAFYRLGLSTTFTDKDEALPLLIRVKHCFETG